MFLICHNWIRILPRMSGEGVFGSYQNAICCIGEFIFFIFRTRLGINWLQGILKRNLHLSIRQPESCSISSATAFNKHTVSKSYDNLAEAYSFTKVLRRKSRLQFRQKILVPKGRKQVLKVTSGKRGTLVTTCFINRYGNSYTSKKITQTNTYCKLRWNSPWQTINTI